MNVSSILVKTVPDRLTEAITEINAINNCEVYFSDVQGKLIVTIEGECINDQMETMKYIQELPFVLNANLMYSYCEDEISEALKKIRIV